MMRNVVPRFTNTNPDVNRASCLVASEFWRARQHVGRRTRDRRGTDEQAVEGEQAAEEADGAALRDDVVAVLCGEDRGPDHVREPELGRRHARNLAWRRTRVSAGAVSPAPEAHRGCSASRRPSRRAHGT
jgi:hypothetical protein